MKKTFSKSTIVAHADGKAIYLAKGKLFQQLFDMVTSPTFDDFTLDFTGTVSNVNKFHEVEQKFPYWKIGFVKNKGKKKKIQFEVSKNFKDMEEWLLEQVHLEDEFEDEMFKAMCSADYFW